MKHKQIHFADVVIMLDKNYKKALQMEYIKKPLAYALYQVWKKVDEVEYERT